MRHRGGSGGDASHPDTYVPDAPQTDAKSCDQDAAVGPTGWTPVPWSCGCELFTPDGPEAEQARCVEDAGRRLREACRLAPGNARYAAELARWDSIFGSPENKGAQP